MKRNFGKGCIVAVCLGLALAFSGCTKKEEAPEVPAQETPADATAPADDATAPADDATAPAEGEAPADATAPAADATAPADAAAPAETAPATPAQ